MGSLNEVIAIARQAGAIILRYYQGEIASVAKADKSPVTKADLAANQHIVAALQALTPDIPILAEESGIPPFEERQDWTRFWLVDPLDGTKEFLKKNGEFTVNIALVENGEPVLGVLYAPAWEVLYYACKGQGSWKVEGASPPVRIFAERADKSKPLVVAESRSHRSPAMETWLSQFQVAERIEAGSALKFGLLAEGKADIYPRFVPCMEWDVAAGDCIWRNAARQGQHASELTYNKPDLRNSSFVLGF